MSCKEEYVYRTVIADRMLAALTDDAKVAIVLNEQDLRLLIATLEVCVVSGVPGVQRMVDDLTQLAKAAFPVAL